MVSDFIRTVHSRLRPANLPAHAAHNVDTKYYSTPARPQGCTEQLICSRRQQTDMIVGTLTWITDV